MRRGSPTAGWPARADSQQTDERIDLNERPDNLFEPVPGDHGARGVFDGQAHGKSPQLWVVKNRGWLALAGGSAVACAAWIKSKS